MSGKVRIDWIVLKSEYVTTLTTLLELSEKHGVSMSALMEKSAEEGWPDERRKYREMVEKKTEEKVGTKVAEERANQIKVGKAMEAIGLKFITASHGEKPRYEPEDFKDAVDIASKGSKIVTDNLPKTDRLEIVDSRTALRQIAEAMQISLDKDYEREHTEHSEVS